jgi:hypothetical protein
MECLRWPRFRRSRITDLVPTIASSGGSPAEINAAVIASAIGADELGHPTPCPKYDVAGLIDHLVEAGHRAAALGRGLAPRPETDPRTWSWDLARATGQTGKLDPSLTVPALEEVSGGVRTFPLEPLGGARCS